MSRTGSAVWWFGRWEHDPCGASGEADWPDESTPTTDHECDQADDDVTWSGEWTCEKCGAGGDHQWSDGDSTYADHECDDEDAGPVDGDDQDVKVVAA
jgi:hypothetical protein